MMKPNKKTAILVIALIAALCLGLCACGEEPLAPEYTASSLNISNFTEIAGENLDEIKEDGSTVSYIYYITDSLTGAAAYDLYKDYLDSNFTYSMIDSTVVGDGFCAVYFSENGDVIQYTEAVAGDGSYTITVTLPK